MNIALPHNRMSKVRARWRVRFVLAVLLPTLLASTAFGDGAVTGRVSNAATGALLEGAEITVLGTALRAVTDRDGTFVLTKVPAGSRSLHVYYTGLLPFDKSVEIVSDQVANVSVILNQDVVELQAFTVSVS